MAPTLTEVQRIPTSGARAVESFRVGGRDLLAIPQLAIDVPGTAAGMNVGDSNTEMLILERRGGALLVLRHAPRPRWRGRGVLHHRRPALPGGREHPHRLRALLVPHRVVHLRVVGRPLRAVPDGRRHSPRSSGSTGRSATATSSGWPRAWTCRTFEGVNRHSVIFEWDGEQFVEFQIIPSQWAYNWHPFEVDGQFFVAHADHVGPKRPLRLGRLPLRRRTRSLLPSSGRAFAHFTATVTTSCVVAGLDRALRSSCAGTARRFVDHGHLEGLGARELRIVEVDGRRTADPGQLHPGYAGGARSPRLTSQVYEWRDGGFVTIAEFPTSAARTSRCSRVNGDIEFAVSNALTADVRFADGDRPLLAVGLAEDGRAMTRQSYEKPDLRPAVPGLHRVGRQHRGSVRDGRGARARRSAPDRGHRQRPRAVSRATGGRRPSRDSGCRPAASRS